jgi:hypothetical protein
MSEAGIVNKLMNTMSMMALVFCYLGIVSTVKEMTGKGFGDMITN